MVEADLVHLDEISKKVFNLKPEVARRKAALNKLPVPAFRLTTSGKGPFFIERSVLDKFVGERIASAKKQHAAMAAA